VVSGGVAKTINRSEQAMISTLALLASTYLADLRRDRQGASGIEYALLAAMVAVILAGFVVGIQGSVSTIFTNVNTALAKG
jgi:pilus assembly protein Flp/PilA